MAQRSPVADADPSERVRRPRLPWTLPWSTPVGSTVPHSSYTGTLPSRRRADDITWILAYLKKVLREHEGTDGYSPDNDSGENCNRSDAFSELGTDEEAITDDPHRTASERDAAFGQGAVQAAVNIDSDTDVEFHDADVALPYKSAYTLRMLWEGMPRDGSC
ncbi:hypothetical protein PC118_g20735 [Phytophthora cactorum]|uniref:Uncharacterized protein n=1 Tax=Phytophthora cactorum TaxID=29920 RepID=A0A8T1EYE5_9STRA|nr:hypothetical protein PC118_g20735 [Phytophthora cactorum]